MVVCGEVLHMITFIIIIFNITVTVAPTIMSPSRLMQLLLLLSIAFQ